MVKPPPLTISTDQIKRKIVLCKSSEIGSPVKMRL
jgi:hypothetical protein